MSFLEMLTVGLAVSMDALAVSVSQGIARERVGLRDMVTVGGWFGGFQAGMPAAGYAVMYYCRRLTPIAIAAPYIAAALLVVVGLNMVWESFHGESDGYSARFSPWEMCLVAVATSIDAFVTGIAMACGVDAVPGFIACLAMGVVTFFVCFAGVKLGNLFGGAKTKHGGLFGGIAICLVGIKMFFEAVGLWNLPF
ncbi:MAG: manganese efflux pump MntP family protein [Eubacteriales bacterium]